MIREVRHFAELIDVVDLMESAFQRSKWAGLPGAGIDREVARKRLINARGRHDVRVNGHTVIGATFFMVAEHKDKLTGFMVGEVDRVYGIGTLRQVSDTYLYARSAEDGADPMDWMRLVKAYLDWALQVPKLGQIVLSQTDFIEGEHQAGVRRYFEHLGFSQIGTIYERKAA